MEQTSQNGMPYGHLEDLLKQNLEVAKENNKILRRMYRNSIIGVVVKLAVWLVVLGLPIFFLSSYLGPLMDALTGKTAAEQGLFGLPPAAEVRQLLDLYTQK